MKFLSASFSIAIFCCLLLSQNANAQRSCTSSERMNQIYQDNPGYLEAIQKGFGESQKNNFKRTVEPVTIPVHVIIVHTPGAAIGTGNNLSEAHILSQIDVINQDFRGLNVEYNSVPSAFTKGDANIEWCLADVDPDGNATTGITRYPSNNFSENATKSATGWDRNQYLNIWVTSEIQEYGYAYLASPTSLPNATRDGLVIWTGVFGGPGYATEPNIDLGRTVTHEIGHYLGLNHVWGPDDDSFCSEDDGISDTPPQEMYNLGCPNHPSPTCGNSGDMFMSFMDYSNDACMAAFSAGQIAHMNMVLQGSRSSLLNAASTRCTAPSVDPVELFLITKLSLACFEDQSGFIQLEANSGKPPYEYFIDGISNGDNPVFNMVTAGNHEMIVVDDLGQSDTVYVQIEQAPQIVVQTVLVQELLCNGDQNAAINIAAAGGTGDLNYAVDGIQNPSPNSYIDGLGAGDFYIEVIDESLCKVADTISISNPPNLSISIINIENSGCGDDSTDGEVQLSGFGGTGELIYTIDGQSNDTGLFFGLKPNDYSASVEDENGCIKTIDVPISANPTFDYEIIQMESSSCVYNTGSVTINAIGTGNYTYELDGVSNSDGLFTDLGPGLHSLSITDGICTVTDEIGIEGIFDIPYSIDTGPSACNVEDGIANGELEITFDDDLYELSFTLNGVTNDDGYFDQLYAGPYQLDILSDFYCLTSIMIEIRDYDTPVLNMGDFVLGCGEETSFINTLPNFFDLYFLRNADDQSVYQASAILYAGNWEAVERKCERVAGSFEVVPAADYTLQLSTKTDVTCFGAKDGTIQVTPDAPQSGMIYTIIEEDLVFTQTNTNGGFDGLAGGIYDVFSINEQQCQDSIRITIIEPDLLVVNVDVTDQTIAGEDGCITLTPSGGTPPYIYEIGNIVTSDSIVCNLAAGDYSILVTDANDCKDLQSATISILDTTTETETDQSISVYWSNGALQVNTSSIEIKSYRLFDLGGQFIGDQDQPIYKSNLSAAVYFVMIEFKDGHRVTRPIVKY